jgi:hypothetical protein
MRISSFVIRRHRPISRQVLAAAALASAALTTCPDSRWAALGESTTAPASTAGPAAARQPIAAVRPGPLKSAEYRLAYKFRPNEDVYMPLSVDSKIHLQKGPVEQISSNQSTVERHFHVASVAPDGSAIVDLFIDNVELSYSFNNGTPVVFNTKQKGSPPPGFQGVQNCIGKRGRVRFSAQGTVLSLPNSSPDPSSDPSESFLDLLPAKPVHVGDEWSDDFKIKVSVSRNLNQKITLRRRYALESVNGNVATIRLRIVEITPVEDAQIRAQLVQRTPEGTITFDMNRGVTTARELTCSRTETGIMGGEGMIAATTHIKGSLR